MKVISYALFGFGEGRKQDCFAFADYLRGLHLNIRLASILFPDWKIRLHTDKNTFEGLKHILNELPIQIEICAQAPLTKCMLWRMKPCFDKKVNYVICRDLDSPLTYRDAQAVSKWISNGKVAHAITDSISHSIPMMGGMIGFWVDHFNNYVKYGSWEEMTAIDMSWEVKGMDQNFLTKKIYPCFAKHGQDSITQHYVLGMPNTFLSDYHRNIEDIDIGIDSEYKCTNDLCGHIGASGYYTTVMGDFLRKHNHLWPELNELESKYKDIFYWQNEL